jgi:alpha-mannosidase
VHDFSFAVCAYSGPFAESSVVLDADAYNTRPVVVNGAVDLPPMPVVKSPAARLAAVKWVEDGAGLVLRLVEYRGRGGDVQIRLPFAVRSAAKVNLLERLPEPLEIHDQALRLSLRPWEIATVKLEI